MSAGFVIRPSERMADEWMVDAIGGNGWFVDGFRTRRNALDWALAYLTTANENNVRLQLEEEERKREEELHRQAVLAAVLEQPAEKGKEN